MNAAARAIYTIWLRETIRFLRERVRMVAFLAQPLLYLFIFVSVYSGAGYRFGHGGSGDCPQK